MAYKGFNTLVLEMKERQFALINEYAQYGIPLAVIKLNLESANGSIEALINKELADEKEQYETQLKDEVVFEASETEDATYS